jgi:hypothetical protein
MAEKQLLACTEYYSLIPASKIYQRQPVRISLLLVKSSPKNRSRLSFAFSHQLHRGPAARIISGTSTIGSLGHRRPKSEGQTAIDRRKKTHPLTGFPDSLEYRHEACLQSSWQTKVFNAARLFDYCYIHLMKRGLDRGGCIYVAGGNEPFGTYWVLMSSWHA